VQADDSLEDVADVVGGGGAALVLDGEALAGTISSLDLENWLNARYRTPSPVAAPPRPDR
jgi:hypothetical protein